MDFLFEKPSRRPIRDLNLVPVIDMFTTVIFFLLLSTSFFAFTKVTVPPSKVSVNTDPLSPPPLSTKFLVNESPSEPQRIQLQLTWAGKEPGALTGSCSREEALKKTHDLAKDFIAKYPLERTIQLGLSSKVPYQVLISAMDGLRDFLPDIVLISPTEVEARRAPKEQEAKQGESP